MARDKQHAQDREHAQAPDPTIAQRHQELLQSLLRELAQTDRSAEEHCEREASRLTGAPAEALRACASHAIKVNRELPALLRQESVELGGFVGSTVGKLFSFVREQVADRTLDHERSYRATLLGLRHGIDVVTMLRHVADASGKVEIGGFCTRWLEEREPLVAQVAHAMTWFAHHPAAAVEPAKTPATISKNGQQASAPS